jgi:hypothetical protein
MSAAPLCLLVVAAILGACGGSPSAPAERQMPPAKPAPPPPGPPAPLPTVTPFTPELPVREVGRCPPARHSERPCVALMVWVRDAANDACCAYPDPCSAPPGPRFTDAACTQPYR